MTKLYHEDEGWTVPGTQSRWALRVDVPNAPFDLAVWLNERHVSPEIVSIPLSALSAEDRERLERGEPITEAGRRLYGTQLADEPKPPRVPGHCDACGRSAAGALKLAIGNDVDAIEAWAEGIQVDNLWALGRAAEIVRDRARELGAEWAERKVN